MLVEAASCGRPIVATDVSGCRTLVRDGVEGFLVPVDDAPAVAAALARLAADPSLRARMGAAGRARVLSGYTERQVGDAVAGLYAALLREV
jgi:glycosyltransferase involved in cell wall biosynthesis